MVVQRIVIQLTELRCLTQSEGDKGSEPYLWTTFFAFGAQQQPFQTGPLVVITPSYDAFRTEFPNGLKAGQAVPVPPFIASGTFDIDLDTAPQPKLVGAIAVVMEEDSTPQDSIIAGRIAYSKQIELELNQLASDRISSGNFENVSKTEIDLMEAAVGAAVKAAVGRNQFNPFRNQDDQLGIIFKTFKYPSDDHSSEIKTMFFDFPDMGAGLANSFRLSGLISVGAATQPPVALCASQRAALTAKQSEIDALRSRVAFLQAQLHHATPQQKAALVESIRESQNAIREAEARLPELVAALDACLPHRPGEVSTDIGGTTRSL